MKKERGFTLLQMAMLLAILGLMAVGAANAYKVFVRQAYIDQTDERQLAIQLALKQFYIDHVDTVSGKGYFPCPAEPNLLPTDANYGRSINPDPLHPGGRCRATDPLPAGTKTVRTAGPNVVRIGAVPARTLGLGDDYMKEPFGHLFIYAVTEALTDISTLQLDANGNVSNGNIIINDAVTGTSLLVPPNGPPGTGNCVGQNGEATPYNRALYVVISPGRNGACAWINGNQNSCAGASAKDLENGSINNNVFIGGTYSCLRDKENGSWVWQYQPRTAD